MRLVTCANLTSLDHRVGEDRLGAQAQQSAKQESSIVIRNSVFQNAKVGVSVPRGASISMEGNNFKNVETPIEFRDD